jgi:hypothetical protein
MVRHDDDERQRVALRVDVLLDHPALKHLPDAVGGDEAELLKPAAT